ncbi:hypothetical protein M758_1G289900 [Ceratodon purpureus]|nr:hypothetical protein M758_1G289900 [Ceratodon purpureus]
MLGHMASVTVVHSSTRSILYSGNTLCTVVHGADQVERHFGKRRQCESFCVGVSFGGGLCLAQVLYCMLGSLLGVALSFSNAGSILQVRAAPLRRFLLLTGILVPFT